MEYKNDKLGVSFTVPDTITVREQMAYHSRTVSYDGTNDDLFARSWEAARPLVQDWKCEGVPLDVNIDTETNPRVVPVLMWAGMRVREHINGLEQIAKNS